jgi:hypothetical protein
MSKGKWSEEAYTSLKRDYATKSTTEVFTSKKIHKEMSPIGVKFRECRDSAEFPNSIPIGFMLDVTGSMGMIPEFIVREKMGDLMKTLLDHGVPDAQVLFGGIGDHNVDEAPLQVSQFEPGTQELNKWLTTLWLEGGGGDTPESYFLAWLFFARHTSIDCFEKRGEKGFLFTAGDANTLPGISKDRFEKLMGYTIDADLTAQQLLAEASRMYHVFHLHIHETPTGRSETIIKSWEQLLGENLIMVEDYKTIAEIIATTVAVVRGADIKKVVDGFDDKTKHLVTNALVRVSAEVAKKSGEGVVTL